MAVCVDPNDFQGLWNIEQTEGLNPALVVHQAEQKVALSRELWAHLVSVSYHGDLAVDGGPHIHEDDTGLMMDIGTPGEKLGRVTYLVVGTTPEWILVQRVDNA